MTIDGFHSDVIKLYIPVACFISKILYFAWHQNRNAVLLKKGLSSWFSAVYPFQVLEDMFMGTYASSRVKRKSFYRKRELQMFLLISGGHIRAPKLNTNVTSPYKGAWNVSANNSETVGHKDLKLGQIVYILVFYNISFSWLLPLDGFQFIFLLPDSENDLSIDIDYRLID